MLPVIALVGRPNVGKSTLFNLLTRSRDALVADLPGLTRDRKYGFGKVGPRPYVAVDTGGLTGDESGINAMMARQTLLALEEADHVLFMVDARDGLTSVDEHVTRLVRRSGKPCTLVINKSEGREAAQTASDFFRLGMGDPVAISAAHGDRVAALMDYVLEQIPDTGGEEMPDAAPGIRVAVVGRPNVGKSTLINRLIGEERLVAFDQPGTTRDSVYVPFERDGQQYTLIDTAGIRRRSRVDEGVEKFSIVKALQAIDVAHVVVSLVDAHEGLTDQDVSLMGLVLNRGRSMVIAVNKWDGISENQRERIKGALDMKLDFAGFAERHFISALHGSNVGLLLASVVRAYTSAVVDMPTPELTRVLEQATIEHQPPLVRGRRIKLRYAHQGGRNPPLIVIHGNQTERLPETYKRYLMNTFRQRFQLVGTPMRLELKSSDNPFEGRRNTLTPRQQHHRDRLKRFVKHKK
ncbi:MAG: ribosome biogenesis GTPase Der [Gammaproteobacteria bacterium]|nr:ribosome biogenesis GTPase Der [Gammaproteobacteria bacterium]